MASENETVADVASEMRGDVTGATEFNNILLRFSERFEAAHRREVAELQTKLSNTETARKFFARRLENAKKQNSDLQRRLKVAEDALEKIRAESNQSELDENDTGTVFETADNAIAAIREEGGAK